MATGQPTPAGSKVPVSMRGLIGRINRKLAPDFQKLCKTREGRAQAELGDFYIVEYRRNFVADTRVDPEDLGRELGVLRDYETVIEE